MVEKMIEKWEEYKIINEALKNLVDKANILIKIKKALKHLIKAGGKRTRPIIVLLAGKLAEGSYEEIMDMALAVELIHTASLAHDDVIDNGVMRRNVETLNVKYDPSLAILVGDWLISKSVELTAKYGYEIVRDFAKTGMMMSEGEVLDVYSVKENFTVSDYFKCIEEKTASLFAYSAKNAYKYFSNDKKGSKKLFSYGLNLGLAYQLVDDLIEFLSIYGDKKSNFESITLPMIFQRKFGFEKAVSEVLKIIRSYSEKSKKALSYFSDSIEKRKLERLVDYMTLDILNSYAERDRNRNISSLLSSYNFP